MNKRPRYICSMNQPTKTLHDQNYYANFKQKTIISGRSEGGEKG